MRELSLSSHYHNKYHSHSYLNHHYKSNTSLLLLFFVSLLSLYLFLQPWWLLWPCLSSYSLSSPASLLQIHTCFRTFVLPISLLV
ncbi:unnamed protein product, partial [Vitis vinifera]|uniref:Uncharacterized protein n=1 Tax=Vitis vinifera TaxID=29760 RepID=D7UAC1_VITVI